MRFEHYSQPILPMHLWLRRVAGALWVAAGIATLSLTIGIFGYHELGGLGWIDSLLEASMILGGMGPVAALANNDVKIFASIYALYSGLVLIGTMGIILAPWVHRMLHHFYADRRRVNRGGQKRRASDR